MKKPVMFAAALALALCMLSSAALAEIVLTLEPAIRVYPAAETQAPVLQNGAPATEIVAEEQAPVAAEQMQAKRALTLRSEARAKGKKVTSIKKNALVTRSGGDQNGWSYVTAANGKSGYVESKHLAALPAAGESPKSGFSGVFEVGEYKKGSVYGVNLNKTELGQVKAKVDEIVAQIITPNMSEYDKINALFGYLCGNCVYAADWSKNRANTAWGALIYGEAQCSGYARGFKALCDAAGIECAYVKESGTGNGLHQWNIVRYNGQCYVFDGTGGIAFAPDSIYQGAFTWDAKYPACTDGSMMYIYGSR